MPEVDRPVQRRHVFFFSGFDPKGASYYHRIYREQALLQGALMGVRYTVGGRRKTPEGNTLWTVHRAPATTASQAAAAAAAPPPNSAVGVETTYEYVRWDDIVRAQWPRTALGVFKESLRTYRSAVRPALRAWPAAPNTVRSLFYPVVYWWLAVVLALLVAGGLAWLVGWAAAAGRPLGGLTPLVLAGLTSLAGLAGGVAVLAGAWWLERRLHTSWLLRIFSFAHAWAIDRVPGLSSRLDRAARRIADRLQDPSIDEVLVVGFSVGSMWAVSAAARTTRLPGVAPEALNKLSVLTLGHCIPLLGLMPEADAFRAELQQVGTHAALCWADVSAPGDWGSFALVDPVALCRPAGAQAAAVNPRCVASPRFHTLFTPADYQRLKNDKRRMHMQYLMAAQLPGVYDYFALTAGPCGLRERLARSQLS